MQRLGRQRGGTLRYSGPPRPVPSPERPPEGKLRTDSTYDRRETGEQVTSDVAIPADVISTLYRAGSIADKDFIGEQQYQLADGSAVPSPIFIIRSLKVGDKVVKNVRTSVISVKGNLLLGQSFLNRFNSWLVDNRQRLLFLY